MTHSPSPPLYIEALYLSFYNTTRKRARSKSNTPRLRP
jgi:hypothetical protein